MRNLNYPLSKAIREGAKIVQERGLKQCKGCTYYNAYRKDPNGFPILVSVDVLGAICLAHNLVPRVILLQDDYPELFEKYDWYKKPAHVTYPYLLNEYLEDLNDAGQTFEEIATMLEEHERAGRL